MIEEEMRRREITKHSGIRVVNLTHQDRLLLAEKLVEMKINHSAYSNYYYSASKDTRSYDHTISIYGLDDLTTMEVIDVLRQFGVEYQLSMITPHTILSD